MWWIIIAIIFILITIYILKDTHVKVYYRGYYAKLREEYDLKLPVWALLLIILVYLIPIVNIIAFVAFLIFYIVHAVWDPKDCEDETHMFSLNGNNWVTKSLLAIKEILNKKI
jgi:hypothetical protein